MIQFQWLNWKLMTKKIEQLENWFVKWLFFPLLETFWVLSYQSNYVQPFKRWTHWAILKLQEMDAAEPWPAETFYLAELTVNPLIRGAFRSKAKASGLIQCLCQQTESQCMEARNSFSSLKVRGTRKSRINWIFLLGKTREHIIKYASATVLSVRRKKRRTPSPWRWNVKRSPAHVPAAVPLCHRHCSWTPARPPSF